MECHSTIVINGRLIEVSQLAVGQSHLSLGISRPIARGVKQSQGIRG
jgi:hypothetical protein